MEIAAQTSGHSILVSGGAVIAAMAGLFLMTDTTFNSLAVGSILVVAIAVLGSITVLPALLAKLGRWVDRPRVPLLWRLNRRIGQGGISRRLLGPVLRHPVVALLVGGAIVAALAVPALGMKTHSGNLDTLPGDIAEVQTTKAIDRGVPVRGAGRRGRGPRLRRATRPRSRHSSTTWAGRPSTRGMFRAADRAGRGLRRTVVRRSSSWRCRSRSPTSRSTRR